MNKHRDDDLTLNQLLFRCGKMDPYIMIRLYFDPDIYKFHISYLSTLDFFLPTNSHFIGECRAENVGLCIEMFMARAVKTTHMEDDPWK